MSNRRKLKRDLSVTGHDHRDLPPGSVCATHGVARDGATGRLVELPPGWAEMLRGAGGAGPDSDGRERD